MLCVDVAKAGASAAATVAARPDDRAGRNLALGDIAVYIVRGGDDGVLGVGGSSPILADRLRGGSPAAVSRRPRPRPHLPAPGESVCIAEPPPS